MPRNEPRTNTCTAAIRAGRLAKAQEFWASAQDLSDLVEADDSRSDSCITLCVLAGIAAADVICCARLGQHAQGQSHDEAIALLKSADKTAAKHLSVLLGMKTKAGYSDMRSSQADMRRALRAAGALVEAAATPV